MQISSSTFLHLWSLSFLIASLHLIICSANRFGRSSGNTRIVFPGGESSGSRNPSSSINSISDLIDFRKDSNVTSIRQFLDVFGLDVNRLEENVIGRRGGSPEIPMQANCQMEMRTIDLDTDLGNGQSGRDAETLLFPRCVRVKRCAGCCDLAGRTVCTPTKKTNKQIKRAAIRLKRSSSGPVPEASTQIVSVEVHEECRCMCKVQAEDCSDKQDYHPEECRCACRNSEQELNCRNSPDKIWDANVCMCKCKNNKFCSTGLTFSQESCSCVPN